MRDGESEVGIDAVDVICAVGLAVVFLGGLGYIALWLVGLV